MGEPSDDSTRLTSTSSSPLTGEGVVIDLGTGDGLFVYQSAKRSPSRFYIGIDANPRPLEKISEKIHRKPGKGGLPNVLDLDSLSVSFIDTILAPRYREAGFEVIERGVLSPSDCRGLRTSWAKRLKGSETRTVMYLVAVAR